MVKGSEKTKPEIEVFEEYSNLSNHLQVLIDLKMDETDLTKLIKEELADLKKKVGKKASEVSPSGVFGRNTLKRSIAIQHVLDWVIKKDLGSSDDADVLREEEADCWLKMTDAQRVKSEEEANRLHKARDKSEKD